MKREYLSEEDGLFFDLSPGCREVMEKLLDFILSSHTLKPVFKIVNIEYLFKS